MDLIGFVFELPWDLGISEELLMRWPEGPDPLEDNRGWLRLRTVEVPTQLPLAAADLAYGDLSADETSTEDERSARADAVKRFIDTPYLARRTVALSYVEVAEIPDPASDEMAKLLRAALKSLNDFQISLGILGNDRIRPISLDELPPLLPFIPARRSNDQFVHGPSQMIALREGPNELAVTAKQMNEVESMWTIVTLGEGLGVFYEIVLRGGAARRAGRHREAVTDYATAGELFITTMLGLVGQRCELEPQKLENILDGPFKDRALHLGRLLGHLFQPRDEGSLMFLWWMHCYDQRNSIVHRGADSMAAFSEAARIGLVSMVVDVREAIRKDERLSDLVPLILWGRRVDHTGGGGNSEPAAPSSLTQRR